MLTPKPLPTIVESWGLFAILSGNLQQHRRTTASGDLGIIERAGATHERWQHKPTARGTAGTARIWFYVHERTLFLEQVPVSSSGSSQEVSPGVEDHLNRQRPSIRGPPRDWACTVSVVPDPVSAWTRRRCSCHSRDVKITMKTSKTVSASIAQLKCTTSS